MSDLLTFTRCGIPNCSATVEALGWCGNHYLRWVLVSAMDLDKPPAKAAGACSVDQCVKPARSRGWCVMHYHRMRRRGSLSEGGRWQSEALAECGSYGAYQRHKRQGEAPCDACLKAHREYVQAYRDRHPEYRVAGREQAAARGRAMTRLTAEYPERFRELLDEELQP